MGWKLMLCVRSRAPGRTALFDRDEMGVLAAVHEVVEGLATIELHGLLLRAEVHGFHHHRDTIVRHWEFKQVTNRLKSLISSLLGLCVDADT